jgi:hypothetical protein
MHPKHVYLGIAQHNAIDGEDHQRLQHGEAEDHQHPRNEVLDIHLHPDARGDIADDRLGNAADPDRLPGERILYRPDRRPVSAPAMGFRRALRV